PSSWKHLNHVNMLQIGICTEREILYSYRMTCSGTLGTSDVVHSSEPFRSGLGEPTKTVCLT
ncbi:hypothetical protein, partial [Turicimonas muris]|uniref:hypothetical protein n=1 Tax=Turicimonas muris TaxID=1796652 RepID=UPI003F7317BD